MTELVGKYASAKIFTDTLDDATRSQVENLLSQPCVSGSKIRIMPDCHAGAGCVIGTTMTIDRRVIPSLVGVDIGCGMLATKLKEKRIDLPRFDSVSQAQVPSGMNMREKAHSLSETISPEELICYRKPGCRVSEEVFRLSLGTLGGGNHFWELDRDEEGYVWLVVHTGSRRTGKDVAEYYQRSAYEVLNGLGRERKKQEEEQKKAYILALQDAGRDREIQDLLAAFRPELPTDAPRIPYEMAYCENEWFDGYLHDMRVMQAYAALNRRIITEVILKYAKLHATDQFETVHNYIDTEAMILRKGAVSAKAGERLLIPMNMRDGALICTGKGNSDWNESAPHGAGRLMSRAEAKESITVKAYRESMKGIYSSCVGKGTLDESPFAYKPMDEIVRNIAPAVEIVSHIRPIYNYKAGDEEA